VATTSGAAACLPFLGPRFRNLEYLEGQLDKYSTARQAEAEEADRWGRRQRLSVTGRRLVLRAGCVLGGQINRLYA
jgi:hypothetical protein